MTQVNDKWLGLGVLIFGILFLWFTIKTWTKGDDMMTGNAKGLIASIGSIIIGFLLLIGYFH